MSRFRNCSPGDARKEAYVKNEKAKKGKAGPDRQSQQRAKTVDRRPDRG
jgi:hypothetical protein